ncbi:MAG: hypothetical protein FD133_129 [Erysipelotrichaceae bacterium]|nr:MAG: hypothetical protein FD133_129 [Erysipelotrichaceae bacterium]
MIDVFEKLLFGKCHFVPILCLMLMSVKQCKLFFLVNTKLSLFGLKKKVNRDGVLQVYNQSFECYNLKTSR